MQGLVGAKEKGGAVRLLAKRDQAHGLPPSSADFCHSFFFLKETVLPIDVRFFVFCFLGVFEVADKPRKRPLFIVSLDTHKLQQKSGEPERRGVQMWRENAGAQCSQLAWGWSGRAGPRLSSPALHDSPQLVKGVLRNSIL